MDLVTNVVRGSESDRLLLLLHGYGADERDLGGLLSYLDPRGPVRHRAAARAGRRTARASRGSTWRADPTSAGFAEALAAVDDLLDAACEEHGPRPLGGGRRRVLAGRRARRSRSALGPSDRPRPAGVLAMSPFVAPGLFQVDVEGARRRRRPAPARHRRPDDPGGRHP